MTEETKDTNQSAVATTGGAVALSPQQLQLLKERSGRQKFSVSEMTVPQLKIVQTAGGYMKKSDPDYIKEAQEGQFIDTLTLKLRDAPIRLIIVRFATNYFENKPKMGPMVKMWGTDPSGYDRAAGGDVGVRVTREGNEIRGVGSYHVLLLNEDGSSLPCMMYLGSTAWKEARRLNTLLGALEFMAEDGPFTPPPYTQIYTATTVPMSNDKNSWMSWKFAPGPLTQTIKYGDAIMKKCEAFEDSIDKGLVKVHGEAEDDREMSAAGQGSRRPPEEQGSGERRDDPPPPSSEGDYGGANGAQPGDQKKVPF